MSSNSAGSRPSPHFPASPQAAPAGDVDGHHGRRAGGRREQLDQSVKRWARRPLEGESKEGVQHDVVPLPQRGHLRSSGDGWAHAVWLAVATGRVCRNLQPPGRVCSSGHARCVHAASPAARRRPQTGCPARRTGSPGHCRGAGRWAWGSRWRPNSQSGAGAGRPPEQRQGDAEDNSRAGRRQAHMLSTGRQADSSRRTRPSPPLLPGPASTSMRGWVLQRSERRGSGAGTG